MDVAVTPGSCHGFGKVRVPHRPAIGEPKLRRQSVVGGEVPDHLVLGDEPLRELFQLTKSATGLYFPAGSDQFSQEGPGGFGVLGLTAYANGIAPNPSGWM